MSVCSADLGIMTSCTFILVYFEKLKDHGAYAAPSWLDLACSADMAVPASWGGALWTPKRGAVNASLRERRSENIQTRARMMTCDIML